MLRKNFMKKIIQITVQKVTKQLTLNFVLVAAGLAIASVAQAHCEKSLESKQPQVAHSPVAALQLAHAPEALLMQERTIENYFE